MIPRPSTGTKFTRAWNTVLTLIVGLALFGLGAFLLVNELKTPATAHRSHVYVFAGMAVLGAFVIRPDPLFKVVREVFVIAGPYIPQLKFGSRAGDVPTPPGVAPGTPVPPTQPPAAPAAPSGEQGGP